jgi:hypothetical protein
VSPPLWYVSRDPKDHEDDVEIIYMAIDALLAEHEFARVDTILNEIPVEKLPVLHMLAFASITSSAKERLHERAHYMTRVRKHLQATESSEHVEALLRGLE